MVEGAAFGAVHMVMNAALGAVRKLEEEANLVEGGAVVAPVPSRQQKPTVHPSHLGPREVPAASGAGEVGSKPVAQVVRQQPVPNVWRWVSAVAAAAAEFLAQQQISVPSL